MVTSTPPSAALSAATAVLAAVDPLRCPLCGQSNQCAITAGLAPETCWCMAADIAPAALEAIPTAQRRQACLCPRCAAGQFPSAAAAPGSGDSPSPSDV